MSASMLMQASERRVLLAKASGPGGLDMAEIGRLTDLEVVLKEADTSAPADVSSWIRGNGVEEAGLLREIDLVGCWCRTDIYADPGEVLEVQVSTELQSVRIKGEVVSVRVRGADTWLALRWVGVPVLVKFRRPSIDCGLQPSQVAA